LAEVLSYLSSGYALPCKRGNPEITSFHLSICLLLCQETQNTFNYHLIAVELPFIPKVIDCMHKTIKTTGTYRKRAQHPAVCYPPPLCLSSLSRCRSLCKRRELFFVKPGVKDNGQY